MPVLTDEGRAALQYLRTAMRWLAAGEVVLLAGEWLFGVGFGGLPLGVGLFAFGLFQRLQQVGTVSCRIDGPRLRPLQISALGLITIGVVLAREPLGGPAPLAAVSAWLLAEPRLAVACVVLGVAWLAVLSLQSDCRDEALLRAMGEDRSVAGVPQPRTESEGRHASQ